MAEGRNKKCVLMNILPEKTDRDKITGYIRSNGFSKVSFCMKTEISRPTLDKAIPHNANSRKKWYDITE